MASVELSSSASAEVSRDLHAALQHLQSNLSGILGSVIVDDKGYPLAWDLKGGADSTLIATVGAMFTRVSDRATGVLDFGSMRNVVVTTSKGSIAVFRLSNRLSLVVLLQPSTNNILVMIEITKAIEELREVVPPGF